MREQCKVLFVLFVLTFPISDGGIVSAQEMPPLPDRTVMSEAYWSLWNDDVQHAIDERIEKYRKADGHVELADVKPGSMVRIEQVSSAFLFGANIFNFGQLGSKELDDKYKAVFGDLFNTAAIPFYWKKLEPESGNIRYALCDEDNPEFWAHTNDAFRERFWRRPATDQIVAFCEQKGIYRHGHPIIWGNTRWHHPEWLAMREENVPEMERRFALRIAQLAERYQGRIDRWDVVNESAVDFLNPHHPKYDPDNPKGSYGILPRDYTFKAFQAANKAFPKEVVQSINDYANNQLYVDQVNDLRRRGCRIDMMGLQMHLFKPKQCADIAQGAKIQHPEAVIAMLKTVGKANLPLHLSEITITAPNDDAEGRAIQANIARNLYRLWFSWPSMAAITWWNVVDGCGAPGEPTTSGLFTRQMEPKASYEALARLIKYEWRTDILVPAKEEDVVISFRGFKGRYHITWTDGTGRERTREIVLK